MKEKERERERGRVTETDIKLSFLALLAASFQTFEKIV